MRRVYQNLCLATISASVMTANMWKNSMKNVESDNSKILYETLLDFFLQRNGTYFLNKPRTSCAHQYTVHSTALHTRNFDVYVLHSSLFYYSDRDCKKCDFLTVD